ncbi:MAG: 5-formyltetrahydrofolate cyclo-ligase [Weeksellaceae bacterium]|nr:5-formyltetrahydrofolate cyclo-ligase [Weeksellaceae bacterium]
MAASLTKQELRTIYKAKRMALADDDIRILSKKLLQNFILQFNPTENQNINLFLSMSKWNEIDTQIFIDYCFEKKMSVFVPKIRNQTMISIEIFPHSEFEINQWGIKEPLSDISSDADLDFVLAPLLYCDLFGNRVGYGKGFYDQFFLNNNRIRKKIGLSFFAPQENISDVSATDVKLDALITPNLIYNFS